MESGNIFHSAGPKQRIENCFTFTCANWNL